MISTIKNHANYEVCAVICFLNIKDLNTAQIHSELCVIITSYDLLQKLIYNREVV